MLPLTRSAAIPLSVALLLCAPQTRAQAVPAGWRAVPTSAEGVERSCEATGLPTGQFLRVEQTALRPLAGAPIERWLASAIAGDASPGGAWLPAGPPTRQPVRRWPEAAPGARPTRATAVAPRGRRSLTSDA